jgi:hypothetical protein
MLLGTRAGIRSKIGRKAFIKATIALTCAQCAAIFWNRLSLLLFSQVIHKPLNPFWLPTFFANIIALPYALFESLREVSIMVVPLAFFVVGAFIYSLVISRTREPEESRRSLSVVLACLAGGAVAILIFSLPGYTIWGMGTRGRSMMALSVWFAVIFAALYSHLNRQSLLPPKVIHASMAGILMALAAASVVRTHDWAVSWKMQQHVFAALPVADLRETDQNAVIIFDGPFRYEWVSVFDAGWAINRQMTYGRRLAGGFEKDRDGPCPVRRYVVGRGVIHSLFETPWVHIWDGRTVTQRYDLESPDQVEFKDDTYFNPQNGLPASELWVWEYETGKFYKVGAPARLVFKQYKKWDYWLTHFWNSYIRRD